MTKAIIKQQTADKQDGHLPMNHTKDDSTAWTKDAGIRRLVASNTPCFGSWTGDEGACERCPLRKDCGRALAEAVSILAKAVGAASASGSLTAEAAEALDRFGTMVGAALSPTPPHPRVAPSPEGKSMRAVVDGVCARSGDRIKIGAACYFVPGEGVVSAAHYTASP